MLKLVYHFCIFCYTIAIRIAALFNPKAKAWINGRKNVFTNIKSDLKNYKNSIWIHCASLGEFEQGRPLIEKIRTLYPNEVLILTFFSPSGYEIRKNYSEVDFVYYLPADTIGNAKRFIELLQPKLILFIKYEFWFGYLQQIGKNNIPAYLISAKFTPNHHLFRWHGRPFFKNLSAFRTIFVQDKTSYDLLKKQGLTPVIAGDTRFDRVKTIAENSKHFPEIENFTEGNFTVIAGSSWFPDENILAQWIKKSDHVVKFIIAPHNIDQNHINSLMGLFDQKAIKYSEINPSTNLNQSNILIIDSIGLLSQLYQYANLAVIGGGFGSGIHNTQEAIVYGIPVLFGPKFKKFQEAVDLVREKGAFSFSDYEEFNNLLTQLINNPSMYNHACKTAKNYVQKNLGATEKIMATIRQDLN